MFVTVAPRNYFEAVLKEERAVYAGHELKMVIQCPVPTPFGS